MEPRDPEEDYAEAFLRGLGLEVHRIPTGAGRSAEFLVDGDGRGYGVEVKARRNDDEWKRTFNRGGPAMESRSTGWSAWAKGAPREAVKQLAAVDTHHARWWVLWVAVAVEPEAEAAAREVIGSLLGGRQVVYSNSDGEGKHCDCLYAVPGVFERQPDLCGCIVCVGGDCQLFVNEFAPDKQSFEGSRLSRTFAGKNALMTQERLIARGCMMVPAIDVNRRDEGAVVAYLMDKYGLTVAHLVDMKEHSATMMVPRDRPNT